ncbi:hypothetical protein ACFQGT_18070 [Natrialbaceae archaeon GCM10025810]|uniref:hypothetical protein n=1 Tax=Halovalidus salilacus TaxID=3075124 RepID=UPI00361E29C4
MAKDDDRFDATAPDGSGFAETRALDPLADPRASCVRDAQERALAMLRTGVHEGDLPPTVSISGPPGTGTTLTTRRVSRAVATRHDTVAVESDTARSVARCSAPSPSASST